MWFTGVEVEQETSAPPPKKKFGSALSYTLCTLVHWNAGYDSDGGLGLESVVRVTLMRAEEEL